MSRLSAAAEPLPSGRVRISSPSPPRPGEDALKLLGAQVRVASLADEEDQRVAGDGRRVYPEGISEPSGRDGERGLAAPQRGPDLVCRGEAYPLRALGAAGAQHDGRHGLHERGGGPAGPDLGEALLRVFKSSAVSCEAVGSGAKSPQAARPSMSAEAVSSEMSFFIAYPPLWVGVRGAARLKQIL